MYIDVNMYMYVVLKLFVLVRTLFLMILCSNGLIAVKHPLIKLPADKKSADPSK